MSASVVAKAKAIAHANIVPNADQPRKLFDAKELSDLADSISEKGLLQPITVRPLKKGGKAETTYEIVAGERRWRAVGLLIQQGRNVEGTISAIVKPMSDEERDIFAIVENLQRKDVTPLEEARAFKRMLDKGMTAEELGKAIGKAQWRVEERVRLLDLEPALLKLYEGGSLSQEAASEISRVKDHAAQTRLVKLVSSGSLSSFKAIRAAVDAVLDQVTQEDIFGEAAPHASAEDVEMLSRMERKIEQVVAMVAMGWKENECVTAVKVSPDRAFLMAEKLKTIQKAIAAMEGQLRAKAAQASIVLAAAE